MSEIFERIADTDMLYKSTADEHSLVRSTEGELLDMSWQIFKDATKALDEKPTALEVGEREPLVEIALRHLTILKRILRQRNASGVRLAMAQRGQASSFKTVLTVDATSRLIDDGHGLGGKKTKMFAEWEARPYLVDVFGGKLQRRSQSGARPRPFSTLGMESHGKSHFGAYVLSLERRLYVFNHLDKSDQVAHSTFVRGAPVLAAGELRAVDGRLMAITSHSGHYKPSAKAVYDTLVWFQRQCVSLAQTVVFFAADPGLGLAPMSASAKPWVFLSSLPTYQVIVQENLVAPNALKERLLMQAELNRFVYAATAFTRFMKEEEDRKAQELLDFFA